MKICFSTLGCPDWSFNEIISVSKDLGFDGFEVRGIQNQLFAPKARPFQEAHLCKTIGKLANKNLQIPCLTSSICLSQKENASDNLKKCFQYIDLADKAKIPYIRILADKTPHPTSPIDLEFLFEQVHLVSEYAKNTSVMILIETNGFFCDTQKLNTFMNRLNLKNIGVLWDVHHPYRFNHEPIEETYQRIAPWVKFVHVKDSILENEQLIYKMLGYGDIPVRKAIQLLKSSGYKGYISLEWVKRWNTSLESPSIVFPHFKNTLQQYINESGAVKKSTSLMHMTLGDLLNHQRELYPNHEALVYGDQDFTLTYKALDDLTTKIAKGFLSMGIKKGDHVAIWATNYPEWIIAQFATAKIGAILVTVNTNYKIFELEYLLKHSDTTTLILMNQFKDTNYIETIQKLCPELENCAKGQLNTERFPFLKNVIYLGEEKFPGMFNWSDLEALSSTVSNQTYEIAIKNLSIHDTINMQYTSGTTGFPKGVMLSHYNIINNGNSIGNCLKFDHNDRLCIPVPLFHCFGCVLGVLACVTHGSTMVLVDHFNPIVVMKAVSEKRCSALHGVPTMFIAILDHPDFKKYNFSTLRTGIMAGSPCPESVMKRVIKHMNMSEITIAYGQTEASPVCTQTRTTDSLDRRVSTVGQALPNIQCRIVDPETNIPLPPNTPGEFVAKGYNIMKGYYKMPEATESAIDSEGWLHTGDLATVDEYGYFKITGRIKDMIIRGGENIYPKEIEEFLFSHPNIKDVQVVGIPDEQYGEEIGAFIILKDTSLNTTVQEIKNYVLENIARHKVPKYIFFVDSFPLTASGKIQKYKLVDLALSLLDSETFII